MFAALIWLIIVAVVIYVLWLVLNMVPLPQPIRLLITLAFVLVVLFGLLNYLPDAGLPRGRFG